METELIALYRLVVESDKLDFDQNFDQKKVMLDEIRKLKPAQRKPMESSLGDSGCCTRSDFYSFGVRFQGA